MKGLVSILALALALAFTGPAFLGGRPDGRKDRSRLHEGWRRVGCCNERVRSEEAVSRSVGIFLIGRRLGRRPFQSRC